MKSKRIITFSIISVILFSLVIFFPGCGKDEPDVIKVGAVLPLTGNLSQLGEDETDAIEFVLDQINKDKEKIKIVFEDSKGTAKDALAAVRKLELEGIHNIILSLTPPVLAVLPAYQDSNSFFIAQCMTPDVLKNVNNAIRVYLSVDNETTLLADYSNHKEFKKIGIFYINNDFGKSAIEEYKNKIMVEGAEFKEETFNFQDKDYKTQLLSIQKSDVDAILVYSYPQQWPSVIKQLGEINYQGKILANSGLGFLLEKEEYQNLRIIENFVLAAPTYIVNQDEEEIKNFKANFTQKYNKEINYDIIYFYDMMKVLSENINFYQSPNEFRKKIISKSYDGISGKINFNENGDLKSQDNILLVKFLDGEYQLVDVK